jgi:outer membrane biosynthesis protein TonB
MLADESLDINPRKRFVRGALIALAVVLLVGALAFALKSLISAPEAPKRQVAKIALLPDTPPPPPPPPPREEPKKEAPKEDKPQPRQEQPKPQQAPPPETQIKMEGAAGDGPSAFAAGSVSKDYIGGPPGGASAPAPSTADRANERFYANTARQLLRDEIERQLQGDSGGQLVATFAVWVESDGRIRRAELEPSGDATRDGVVQTALDGTARALRLPPPPAVAQPMRFRLTLRGQG